MLDAAVRDANLADGSVTPILKALSAWGIPTVICMGSTIPQDVCHRHPDLITLSTPVMPATSSANSGRRSEPRDCVVLKGDPRPVSFC